MQMMVKLFELSQRGISARGGCLLQAQPDLLPGINTDLVQLVGGECGILVISSFLAQHGEHRRNPKDAGRFGVSSQT